MYSSSKPRNNIGGWCVKNIQTDSTVHGFDFYKQKDIAMADDADYGFMIWDGESRGTLNNIINLISQNKKVLIYLTTNKRLFYIKNNDNLKRLIESCVPKTQVLYSKSCNHSTIEQ